MKSFSSQIGTKNAPGELKPFGWTSEIRPMLRDAIADFEHDRARMEHRSFGRRDILQPIAKRPSILRKRMAGLEIYDAPKIETPVIRHTRLTFKSAK